MVLLSQLSFTRGIERKTNEVSPSFRFSVNSAEMKATNGFQILQRRISLEQNESGLSLDGSIISEIKGESVIDRLKRQIDHDKKLMSSFYKELAEERSASATAANQAMAMITRLQEENVALNMEALQYLIMTEEQTDYDDGALQKANDILAEKEKELQDMENKLEYYPNKYPSESVWETDREIHKMKARDIGIVDLESKYKQALFCCEELILSQPTIPLHHLSYADVLCMLGGLENLQTAKKYYASTVDLTGGKNTRALFGITLLSKGKSKDDKESQELPTVAAIALQKDYGQRAPEKLPLLTSALES